MIPNLKRIAGHSMAGFTLMLAGVIGLAAALLLAQPQLVRQAQASVTNYPPGVSVNAMPMHLGGPYTASSTTAVKFNLPYAGRLIGFGGAAATLSGTIKVDFQSADVSVLSTPLTLSTAYSEAVISTSAIADEATLTAIVTTSGLSATASDITILPTFLRR